MKTLIWHQKKKNGVTEKQQQRAAKMAMAWHGHQSAAAISGDSRIA